MEVERHRFKVDVSLVRHPLAACLGPQRALDNGRQVDQFAANAFGQLLVNRVHTSTPYRAIACRRDSPADSISTKSTGRSPRTSSTAFHACQ